MIYATREFWSGAAERAIATGAQFAVGVVLSGAAAGTVTGETAEVINAFALDVRTVIGAFIGGIVLSVLTSLARADFVAGKPAGSGTGAAAAAERGTGTPGRHAALDSPLDDPGGPDGQEPRRLVE